MFEFISFIFLSNFPINVEAIKAVQTNILLFQMNAHPYASDYHIHFTSQNNQIR